MDLEHPEEMEEPIPQFDAIVGNFPYISADQIEKHDGYMTFLLRCLIADWFDDYPEVFCYDNKGSQDLRNPSQRIHKGGAAAVSTASRAMCRSVRPPVFHTAFP